MPFRGSSAPIAKGIAIGVLIFAFVNLYQSLFAVDTAGLTGFEVRDHGMSHWASPTSLTDQKVPNAEDAAPKMEGSVKVSKRLTPQQEQELHRTADDWICRGGQLNELMGYYTTAELEARMSASGEKGESRSQFTDYSDADKYGWVVRRYTDFSKDDFEDFDQLLTKLNIDRSVGSKRANKAIEWYHQGNTAGYKVR